MFEKVVALARTNSLAASFILGTILILGLSVSYFLPEFQPAVPQPGPSTSTTKVSAQASVIPIPSATKQHEIIIDVQGAVNHPGVYTLPATARVSDALTAAGDISLQADTVWLARNLNRATELHDGDKLYIPKRGESKDLNPTAQSISHSSSTPIPSILGLTSIANTPPAPTGLPQTQPSKISINNSTAAELDGLNGIGAKRAQDIINGRPYTRVEELVEKKIVYQSVFDKIKDQIQL